MLPAAFTFGARPQTGKNLAAGHTWVISQNVVNESRFGYNQAFHNQYNYLPGQEDYTAENYAAQAGLKNIQGAVQEEYRGYPGAAIPGICRPSRNRRLPGRAARTSSVSRTRPAR